MIIRRYDRRTWGWDLDMKHLVVGPQGPWLPGTIVVPIWYPTKEYEIDDELVPRGTVVSSTTDEVVVLWNEDPKIKPWVLEAVSASRKKK
jgi:hypothetical protein